MSTPIPSRWLLPAAFLLAGPCLAADAPPAAPGKTAAADPLDATVAVPRATHRSSFSGYRTHAEPEVRNWRAANDEVGRIGGWRSYAREASGSASSASAPVSAPPSGAMPAASSAPAAPAAPASRPDAAGKRSPAVGHGSH